MSGITYKTKYYVTCEELPLAVLSPAFDTEAEAKAAIADLHPAFKSAKPYVTSVLSL